MSLETLDTVMFVVFVFLGCLTVAWLVLILLLFSRLRCAHPQKYEQMGRPGTFKSYVYFRQSLLVQKALWKFLYDREYKMLGDSYLSKLSDALRIILIVYIPLFLWMFLMIAIFGNEINATH